MSIKTHIVYEAPSSVVSRDTISFEKHNRLMTQRRRNAAKRALKKSPLFAVVEIKDKFGLSEYNEDDLLEDARRRTKKKSIRKIKSPITRQGRYSLMQHHLIQYKLTKEVAHLEKAQGLRNRMFKPYEVQFKLKDGSLQSYTFPSVYPVSLIQKIASIKFSDLEDLDSQIEVILKHVNYR